MEQEALSAGDAADVVVVGGGAAGLMAAICAGQTPRTTRRAGNGGRIVLVDGAARLGAKILVSGGGRCNVTHMVVGPEDYAGASRHAIAKVIRSFPVNQTLEFFQKIGVTMKQEETGKMFPVTNQARTVLEALREAALKVGVEMRTGWRVDRITREGEGFTVACTPDTLRAARVILATGGQSLPKTGSDGAGYELAQALGHTVSPTFPALVPLVLAEGHWLTALSGLSFPATLTVAGGTGKILRREQGPLLLTHFGISGPVVLDVSRHWLAARREDAQASLTANLVEAMEFPALEQEILKAAGKQPRGTALGWLRARFPQRFAQAVLRQLRLEEEKTLGGLTREQRRELVRMMTALPLPVVKDRGWIHAEVTAGGVPLAEVETGTMESRKCPGLYLCGEILDVDGRVGGFNFQWAWCTGRLAGIAAMKEGG